MTLFLSMIWNKVYGAILKKLFMYYQFAQYSALGLLLPLFITCIVSAPSSGPKTHHSY